MPEIRHLLPWCVENVKLLILVIQQSRKRSLLFIAQNLIQFSSFASLRAAGNENSVKILLSSQSVLPLIRLSPSPSLNYSYLQSSVFKTIEHDTTSHHFVPAVSREFQTERRRKSQQSSDYTHPSKALTKTDLK